MNGLVGASPWGRQAIYAMDDAEREVIEDAIPDGYSLVVAAERRPGTWVVRLALEGVEVDRIQAAHHLGNACRTLLERIGVMV